MKRRYYSVRTGKNPRSANIDLKTFKSLFYSQYSSMVEAGYFQEYFGYSCVDSGDVPGKLGGDMASALLFNLRKEHLWPIPNKFVSFSEEDVFDIVEFFHDHVSKPIDGYHHTYAQCGMHYHTFDRPTGLSAGCGVRSCLLPPP